ncbi:MAG: 50S ribosomal protein L29 [Rickettsiales bacterium]|jgi:ribosomal protein L29|nr:50S ribosomal protein L29 [Rickettsiales bacterium]
MKYTEIKSKTNDELKKIYVDYKKKLYNLGVLSANGENKDTSRYSKYKKVIAKILTRLNEIKNA